MRRALRLDRLWRPRRCSRPAPSRSRSRTQRARLPRRRPSATRPSRDPRPRPARRSKRASPHTTAGSSSAPSRCAAAGRAGARGRAQFNLAALYENGQGVAQNDAQTARWYLKAAEQGDAEAQFRMGRCSSRERASRATLDKASYWYGKVLAEGRGDAADRPAGARPPGGPVQGRRPGDVFAYPGGRAT